MKDHPTRALRFPDDDLELIPSYVGRPEYVPPNLRLVAAVNSLPSPLREVIEWTFWERVTRVEVARRLETGVTTVKRWERQALQALKEALSQ